MDKEFLYKLIDQIVNRLKNGEQVEENKIELKSEWYHFSEKENRKKIESEFLKDLSAIANTAGPTGYLIIGIDEKSGEIKNSPFTEGGYKDVSDLYKLVVKSVDKQIDFEYCEIAYDYESFTSIIGVFTIPPSLDKPHMITRYISKSGNEIQNFIPVKKLTGIYPASRSDIELMYYDRKNIEPEFALDVKVYKPHLGISGNQNEIRIDFQICYGNFGRKPITVVEVVLKISEIDKPGLPDKLDLKLERYQTNKSVSSKDFYLPLRFIIVPSNSVETIYSIFKTTLPTNISFEMRDYLVKNRGTYSVLVEATDLNGKKYQTDVKEF